MRKIKNEKIALSTIDVYKNYIDLPCIFNCEKTHVFKTKLQSHFLQPKTVKSIKWILNII